MPDDYTEADAFAALVTKFAADVGRLLAAVNAPDCPPAIQHVAREVGRGAEAMLRRLIEAS